MANLPLSGTDIRLLKGIPFSSDKKHTRWFDSVNEQTTYFLNKSPVHVIAQGNFQRVGNSTILSVNKSVDDLYGTNYVMFKNATYNKWFYGFVEKLEYVQKNTTYVHIKLDVFQTWKFHMIFNPSMVLREHRPQYYPDGRPVLNTIDEGLDYGQEYETMKVEKYQPNGTNLFLVIISKSSLHDDLETGQKANDIAPIINGIPQPLSYYIHPFKMGTGGQPKINVGGKEVTLSNILTVLKSASGQRGTVNNIVSMYITDDIGLGGFDRETDTFNFSSATMKEVYIQDNGGETEETIKTLYVLDHSSYKQKVETVIPNKYSDFKEVSESKLLMYPYTTIVMDDFKGNRVELKPELIQTNEIAIRTMGSLGLSNKVVYEVTDYLYRDYKNAHGEQVLGLENAVVNNTPQDVPVISDYLAAYLQGNRNSIQTQQNSIMWNGASQLMGNVMNARTGGAENVGQAVTGAGNTVLELQAIQSKLKDIGNTPPTIGKMGSNTAFEFGNNVTGVYIIKKQITQEYINKLENFFNMYGYKTQEVKIPNFHTRKYWNYVETSDCVIRGNIASEDLNELKAIFDNGITLWHTDEIGNYNLKNEVL